MTILFNSCKDDEITLPNPDEYTDALTFFEELNYNGSVLISKNDTDILRMGFGEANRNTGTLNDSFTKFRIGSVSKTFTGMGIIQLKRNGLINSFDQSLNEFDESFPNGNLITIRHLLTHQSGIPDYIAMIEKSAKNGETYTPENIYSEIKNYIAEHNLDFIPGNSVNYSNSNFLIAAMLIEKLSGEIYEDFIKTHVLDILDMTDTEMGTNEISGDSYAQGYNGSKNVSTYPMDIAFGAGCWTSTISDLEKWCLAIMGDNWFSAEEKATIFGGEVPEESTAFGLAWFKSKINGEMFFWHGGDIDGFVSLIGVVPESKGVIITLSNEQDDTGAKRNLIIETIVKKELTKTE